MKIKNIIGFVDCMFDAFCYSFWMCIDKLNGSSSINIEKEIEFWNGMLKVSEDIITRSNSSETKSLRLQVKIILYVLNLIRTK